MIEKIRHIAIVGAGFAGLSLGWQLIKGDLGSSLKIDIFEDPKHPAASQIATGLLHYFHGTQARIPPMGKEAYEEALIQIREVSTFESLARPLSLIRPAYNRMQQSIFKKRARQNPKEASYKPIFFEEAAQKELTPEETTWALNIHNAYLINSPAYLEALRKELIKKGVCFITSSFHEENASSYDKIFFACGWQTRSLSFLNLDEESWHLTRGQICQISLKNSPPVALNGKVYLIPHPEKKEEWILGSTFEKLPLKTSFSFEDFDCDARKNLCQEAQKLWKEEGFSSLDLSKEGLWQIGYRLAGPSHLPLIQRIDKKRYLFTGLGSKGLLYSAFMAKKLISSFIKDAKEQRNELWSYQIEEEKIES